MVRMSPHCGTSTSRLGLGQQVPPQLGVAQVNMHEDGHHIVIKGTSLDLMEVTGHVAEALKGLASSGAPSKSGSATQ
eukprot:83491-Prorocentrum_lima.AAC.1